MAKLKMEAMSRMPKANRESMGDGLYGRTHVSEQLRLLQPGDEQKAVAVMAIAMVS